MGQQDVRDAQAEALGILEVLADVALRVDDGREPGAFVADQVGSVRETAEVVLLQDHPWLRRPGCRRIV
jgi:hypothetical protein